MTEWLFTQNGHLFHSDNEDGFIKAIVSGLNFEGKVYLSRSENNEIKEWEGGNDDDTT